MRSSAGNRYVVVAALAVGVLGAESASRAQSLRGQPIDESLANLTSDSARPACDGSVDLPGNLACADLELAFVRIQDEGPLADGTVSPIPGS